MDAISQPAQVEYGHGQFRVLSPGTFVVCAVTGQRIPLNNLKYWSVEKQEAYASAEAAHQRGGYSPKNT